ncbi:hypothetical protein DICVIV_13322 [Dictyocaulus viviparus]|uniref:Uncharacterized protein n=1 Tax=Dictyocaulus viviparus TaxID=29172 RepID=A0A0D8X851_DICVI|nr:hypothetical protein DICVIV_13322 [Dictyocaulus viviparus]
MFPHDKAQHQTLSCSQYNENMHEAVKKSSGVILYGTVAARFLADEMAYGFRKGERLEQHKGFPSFHVGILVFSRLITIQSEAGLLTSGFDNTADMETIKHNLNTVIR